MRDNFTWLFCFCQSTAVQSRLLRLWNIERPLLNFTFIEVTAGAERSYGYYQKPAHAYLLFPCSANSRKTKQKPRSRDSDWETNNNRAILWLITCCKGNIWRTDALTIVRFSYRFYQFSCRRLSHWVCFCISSSDFTPHYPPYCKISNPNEKYKQT